MSLIVTIISIWGIAGLFWIVNHIFDTKVCPICAGVSGTWIWILVGMYFDWLPTTSYQLLATILMGGSVVGTAYQLEKKVRPGKILIWKMTFIPAGFLLAYNIIYFSWFYALLTLTAIFLFIFIFLDWPISKTTEWADLPTGQAGKVKDIEKEMENCC